MAASFEILPCVRVTIENPTEKDPPYTMVPAVQAFAEWVCRERVYPLRGTCSVSGWFYCADFRAEDAERVRAFLQTLLPEVGR